MSGPARGPTPAAADLATAVETWLGRLADERRRSEHTIAAYRRDLDDFLRFLAEHRGAAPDLAALGGLTVRDLRAWLARRAAKGSAKTSTARALSAGLGRAAAVHVVEHLDERLEEPRESS